MNFQSKHWFDCTITLRWLKWLIAQFPPSETLGLIWDAAPMHGAGAVKALLEELEEQRRLFVTEIPSGLTSIIQLGDIVINGPCKKYLRKKYLSYQFSEIKRLRATGKLGRIVVKISREQLMTWVEMFVMDFNSKEISGATDIIVPCLSKIGQNCFSNSDDKSTFYDWLDSLNENALYKSLLEAHTAVNL